MIARKVPSGAKHAPCFDHVPHPYTSTGWLCVGTREPDRAADMVAFADHLAAVAAAHRPTLGGIDFGTSHLVRAIRPDDNDIRPTLAECDWTSRALSCQLPVNEPAVVAPVIPAAEPVKVARKAQKRPSPMAAAIDALAARTAERGVPLVQPEPIIAPDPDVYVMDAPHPLPDPVALAALDGYEYQSCELPGWNGTEAHCFLEALRGALISALPGYSEAGTWSIDDRVPA